ncbi:hypothetical protein ACTNDG_05485 [Clostridium sp. HCP1S3_B4]|uniref:hypothetical protein n=1 Tax=unclassified Clostridium TaxID=2614128 RepID=UPI002A7D242A|nr:hypothetical protein [Clostridiales bacterium]MDY2728943.1 hypothetical protein [Clostridium sp.]
MITKKTILSLLCSGVVASTFLLGCGCNNTTEGAKEDIEEGTNNLEEGAEHLTDNVKNAGESLYNKVTDTSMEYSKDDFIASLKNDGIETAEFENKTEYFTADRYGYKIGDDSIYVYEYDTKGEADIEKDINSIKDNGNRINDAIVQWNSEAHIYKKGRLIVIYDGNNKDILNKLNGILGNPILG